MHYFIDRTNDKRKWYNIKHFNIFGLPVLFVYITLLLIFVLSNWHTHRTKKSKVNPYVSTNSHLYTITFMGCLFCNWVFVTVQWINYSLFPLLSLRYMCIERQWIIVIMLFGRLSLYAFFSQRLHQSFHNTQLALKSSHICWPSLIGCSVATSMTIIYLYMFLVQTDCILTQTSKTVVLIATIQDIIWGLTLTACFTSKLIKSIQMLIRFNEMPTSQPQSQFSKMEHSSKTDSNQSHYLLLEDDKVQSSSTIRTKPVFSFFISPASNTGRDYPLTSQADSLADTIRKQTANTQQKMLKLLYLVYKLTILMLVSVLFTASCFIWWTLYLPTMAYAMEVCMSSTCLVLSFQHYDRYYRFFCFPCRWMCCEIHSAYIKKFVKKQIDENRKQFHLGLVENLPKKN
ncbi:hypothetical protein RFI_07191 [Reticulomyxa filosa]|uniref:Uncharacterized protein n=1 Tax=Reticulomyxa filosa TaxID=46433 RepID=X6NVA5_RETFI|nr:hypothetical protein RFI_07191 [Reticulomyxa filosa]|eukprot:ETO29926.1 hypothetical protein RFI_07191 [Reticulomyxa filosa]